MNPTTTYFISLDSAVLQVSSVWPSPQKELFNLLLFFQGCLCTQKCVIFSQPCYLTWEKGIISANKTHFGIFFRLPPDTKTILITSAFLYVGTGQQHKGQAMAQMSWECWIAAKTLKPGHGPSSAYIPGLEDCLRHNCGTQCPRHRTCYDLGLMLYQSKLQVHSPYSHLESLLSFASLFSRLIFLTKPAGGRDGGEGTTSCRSISSVHTGMRLERDHE